MEKSFRMPHSFTIIFSLIVIVALLTWILPAGQFDRELNEATGKEVVIAGTYHLVEQKPQGIMSILMAMAKGIIDAAEVIAFILIVGGSYGVIMKTGAIDAGISVAIKKLGNKDKLIIPLLMILFSIGGTTTGMWEETLPFYLIIIPFMLALGYDAIVAISILLLGCGVGTLASTVNPFATGVASAIAGISLKEGFYFRVALLIISVTVAIIYVFIYAIRVKKDPTKSIIFSKMKDHRDHFLKSSVEGVQSMPEFTLGRKIVLTLFITMILFLTYSIIEWGWWMPEMTMLYLGCAIISAIVCRINETDMWNAFIEGSKDLLSAALVIGLARGVVIVANEGFIIDTILNSAATILRSFPKELFIISNEIVQLMIGFVVPSSSGHATLTMSIMAPLSDFLDMPRSSVVTAMQTASGLINLITPTSGVLMAAIGMARINYGDWLKFVMPLFVIEFIISILVIIANVYL